MTSVPPTRFADRVVVMYAGQEMEAAPTDAFFRRPAHPYTRRLLQSVPGVNGELRDIPGEVPSLVDPPPGCRFHPRCDYVSEACLMALPEASLVGAEHEVRCHHPRVTPAEWRERERGAAPGGRRSRPAFSRPQRVRPPHGLAARRRRRVAVRADRGDARAGRRERLRQVDAGKTVMGIHAPTAGEIRFLGREIGGLPRAARRKVAKDLQYVYQDPGASLDPRWKIVHSLHEPLRIHTTLSRAEREAEVQAILHAVGLPDAHLDLYPHELSGGQQRRVGLARILTLRPRMVILDEPTSGLDVSVQASVLKLFRSLQETFALTYLFISHDLSVVRAMCQRLAVMYLGKIVESGDTRVLFERPRHPYTQSLLAAVPRIGGRRVTQEFASRASRPTRVTSRAAAASARAVRSPRTSARPTSRRSATWPAASSPATSRDRGRRTRRPPA